MVTDLSDDHRRVLATWASAFSRAAATAVDSCVVELGRLAVAIRRALDLPAGAALEPTHREILDASASGAAGKFGYWPNLTPSLRALLQSIDGAEAAPGVIPDLERIFGDLERDHGLWLANSTDLREILGIVQEVLLESDARIRADFSLVLSSLVSNPPTEGRERGDASRDRPRRSFARGARVIRDSQGKAPVDADADPTPGEPAGVSISHVMVVDSLIPRSDGEERSRPERAFVSAVSADGWIVNDVKVDDRSGASSAAEDLRTSWGESVDRESLLSARDFGRTPLDPIVPSLYDRIGGVAGRALGGESSAIDEFAVLAGTTIDGVEELNFERPIWLAAYDSHDGERHCFVAQTESEDGSFGVAIDAAQLVAWIGSEGGRARLTARGILPSGVPKASVADPVDPDPAVSEPIVVESSVSDPGFFVNVVDDVGGTPVRFRIWAGHSSEDVAFQLRRMMGHASQVGMRYCFLVSRDFVRGWDALGGSMVFGMSTLALFSAYAGSDAGKKIREADPEYLSVLTCAWLSDLVNHWSINLGAAPGEAEMRGSGALRSIVSAARFLTVVDG